MIDTPQNQPETGRKPKQDPRVAALHSAAYSGDLAGVKRVIAEGVNINEIHVPTGLSALHVAVGTNNLPLVKYLIKTGAKFGPDGFGRWPTVIAAQCYASAELCDYIVEQEAASLQNQE